MFLKVVIYRNVAAHTFKHSKRYNRGKIKICYLPEYVPLTGGGLLLPGLEYIIYHNVSISKHLLNDIICQDYLQSKMRLNGHQVILMRLSCPSLAYVCIKVS